VTPNYATRQGVQPVSWEEFHGICKALARAATTWRADLVLAIGRGGYYPGSLIAHMLQLDIFPVRLSRRVNDVVKFSDPQWLVEPPPTVRGRNVLVVDEMCSSGQTLTMVKTRADALGARQTRTAVLYAHTWGRGVPDAIGIVTDALVLNPWDREILRDGCFILHPEYAAALRQQGAEPSPDMLIQAPEVTLARGPASRAT
jgi:hypoxanthine phosphoribosyltransferase